MFYNMSKPANKSCGSSNNHCLINLVYYSVTIIVKVYKLTKDNLVGLVKSYDYDLCKVIHLYQEKGGLSLTRLLAHYCRSLSRFLFNKATMSIATPCGWNASPLQVNPPEFDSSLVPIHTPG